MSDTATMQETTAAADGVLLRRLTNASSVHQKIRMLPLLAGVALLTILLLTVIFGMLNERQLSHIEREQYPALRMSDSLQSLLGRAEHELDDALDHHEGALASADSLRDRFLATVDRGAAQDELSAAELRRLRSAFAPAYQRARAIAATAAASPAAVPSGSESAVREQFRGVRHQLATRTARQAVVVERAFTRARALHRGTGCSLHS